MIKVNKNKIWSEFLKIIKNNVSEVAYQTWFTPFYIHEIDEDSSIIYLSTKDTVVINFIPRYLSMCEETFEKILNKKYKVIAKLENEYENRESARKISVRKTFGDENIFNPRMNFSNFVVGNNNKLAFAASLAVAESPSEAYNPLFLYGGSGLGKTHLMQAIGIHATLNHPEINILYVSSEMFTNEFINALKENKMSKFKNKYRKVDILLIDDIQFLENKTETQEEFFHTFNSLYENNKQIVISSDRPAKKLKTLDDRLTSRFLWNMSADLQPADFETRMAILQKKAENAGLDYTDDVRDVCTFIASKITDNIRELEGTLNRVIGASNLLHEKIYIDLARRALQELVNSDENGLEPERIKSIVASYYGIRVADMDSKKRNANIAFPRQVAIYLCRQYTSLSLSKIGMIFGGRDHSTVVHSCDRIQKLEYKDNSFKEDLKILVEKINDN